MTTDQAGLSGKTAVVAGASGGIGRAVALALGAERMRLVLVGRDGERLGAVLHEAGPAAQPLAIDLVGPDAAEAVAAQAGEAHVLVWSASAYAGGSHAELAPDQAARLFENNVQACYRLVRALLPALIGSRGQVVFINSTQGLNASEGVGVYAGTQHALRAMADSLRHEVNRDGVRVLTIYVGRTATPMQERIFATEGRPYAPEMLVQPEDIAAMVIAALKLPYTAEVTELTIRPMLKS